MAGDICLSLVQGGTEGGGRVAGAFGNCKEGWGSTGWVAVPLLSPSTLPHEDELPTSVDAYG